MFWYSLLHGEIMTLRWSFLFRLFGLPFYVWIIHLKHAWTVKGVWGMMQNTIHSLEKIMTFARTIARWNSSYRGAISGEKLRKKNTDFVSYFNFFLKKKAAKLEHSLLHGKLNCYHQEPNGCNDYASSGRFFSVEMTSCRKSVVFYLFGHF